MRRCPRCNAALEVVVHVGGYYQCSRQHDGRTAYYVVKPHASEVLRRADGEVDRLLRGRRGK